MAYDITLIGNYTKDKIVTPSEVKHVDGGGFNYGAHAAVALGAKTSAITRLKKNRHTCCKQFERDWGENISNIYYLIYTYGVDISDE